jgi:NADH-quinone oxidoreductase subunit C
MEPQQVLLILEEGEYPGVEKAIIEHGQVVVSTPREKILSLAEALKNKSALQCDMLLSVTAIDWLDRRGIDALASDDSGERFQVVYHFRSLSNKILIRVKCWVPEEDCRIDSLYSLYFSANFLEREVWDMYGIKFNDHPDLRRVLMYEEFKGHPLRKDYPVQGKQPRVALRSPEVRNTAVDMQRPELVQIRRRNTLGI